MKKYVKSTTDTPEVLYELECSRSGISPREFYRYCDRRFKQKTGDPLDNWVDYAYWADESHNYHNKTDHTDWDMPATEVITERPYEVQFFLTNAYNFILEFEFGDDDTGNGYMYVKEYKR